MVAAGLAVTTAVLGTGLGAWQSYQPSKLESFSTTGLLGTLRRNAGLLSDVETRAQQATPYVRNLLALSQALQEKFVPGEINQPTAARILLVSDVHGANQYPVMKRIIADEQIDAVIDAGDLLNFGSVAEAQAAGLFSSIAGLGVPYLFVRGNHDAGSPDDQALLQRMSRLRNVVLLEGAPGDYTQASVNGVTIAGFNDPRWFGDDNKDNAAKQTPAAEAFNRAYAGRHVPDVVVSHEHGAAGTHYPSKLGEGTLGPSEVVEDEGCDRVVDAARCHREASDVGDDTRRSFPPAVIQHVRGEVGGQHAAPQAASASLPQPVPAPASRTSRARRGCGLRRTTRPPEVPRPAPRLSPSRARRPHSGRRRSPGAFELVKYACATLGLLHPPAQLVVVAERLLPAHGRGHSEQAQAQLPVEPAVGVDPVSVQCRLERGDGVLLGGRQPGTVE